MGQFRGEHVGEAIYDTQRAGFDAGHFDGGLCKTWIGGQPPPDLTVTVFSAKMA